MSMHREFARVDELVQNLRSLLGTLPPIGLPAGVTPMQEAVLEPVFIEQIRTYLRRECESLRRDGFDIVGFMLSDSPLHQHAVAVLIGLSAREAHGATYYGCSVARIGEQFAMWHEGAGVEQSESIGERAAPDEVFVECDSIDDALKELPRVLTCMEVSSSSPTLEQLGGAGSMEEVCAVIGGWLRTQTSHFGEASAVLLTSAADLPNAVDVLVAHQAREDFSVCQVVRISANGYVASW